MVELLYRLLSLSLLSGDTIAGHIRSALYGAVLLVVVSHVLTLEKLS